MSGFAAFNHLIRWTVGHTSSLEYCDTWVGRETMAHDHKYQIHWPLTHLITGLKEDVQTEAVVRLHIVNVQKQEQILPSGRASNAVIYVVFVFCFDHNSFEGSFSHLFSIWTHHKTHTHKKTVRLWRDSDMAHGSFVFCFFFPSCYKNVISECSVTSSLNGFQPWDYFSIEYGVYG